jgi:hypothetical protein
VINPNGYFEFLREDDSDERLVSACNDDRSARRGRSLVKCRRK